MSPLCLRSRRRVLASLEGELRPAASRRLERHLARCGSCRRRLARLKAGLEAGRSLGRFGSVAPSRLPSFEEIRDGLARAGVPASPAVAWPALLTVVAGLAAIVLLAGRGPARHPESESLGPASIEAPGPFARLAIREFGTASTSRVFTEGFVQDVYFDKTERSLHIKLAESPRDPGPFVICEVLDVRGLTIPQTGSRIRVYGTARYDGQPGREWHEVNPVMQIAVLNR